MSRARGSRCRDRLESVVPPGAGPIFRECRVVPDRIIECYADKPAKQQVVTQLLTQLRLTADRIEHLQQESANQLLRCDRVAAGVSVNLAESRVHRRQRIVHQHANRPQRMIGRHKVVQLGHCKQAFLHRIRTTHRSNLEGELVNTLTPTIAAITAFTRRISTAC